MTLLGLTTACGGGANGAGHHSNDSSTVGQRLIGLAAWDAKTQQLCREKETAIAGLGNIHITYGGIARYGLLAVKRLLDRYLDRLLAVLREFALRQRALTTPVSLVGVMSKVRAVDGQIQAATERLRSAVANVTSAAGLSAVFRAWLVTLQHLAGRGEVLAVQLKLPACESQSAATNSSAS